MSEEKTHKRIIRIFGYSIVEHFIPKATAHIIEQCLIIFFFHVLSIGNQQFMGWRKMNTSGYKNPEPHIGIVDLFSLLQSHTFCFSYGKTSFISLES